MTKAKGKAALKRREGAKAAAVRDARNVARAWAATLVAKLNGLAESVGWVRTQLSPIGPETPEAEAAGRLLARVLHADKMIEMENALYELAADARDMLRGDAGAELPDVEAAALQAGRLLVLAD